MTKETLIGCKIDGNLKIYPYLASMYIGQLKGVAELIVEIIEPVTLFEAEYYWLAILYKHPTQIVKGRKMHIQNLSIPRVYRVSSESSTFLSDGLKRTTHYAENNWEFGHITANSVEEAYELYKHFCGCEDYFSLNRQSWMYPNNDWSKAKFTLTDTT